MKKSTKAEPVPPAQFLVVVHVDGYGGSARWNAVDFVSVGNLPEHPSIIPGTILEVVKSSGMRTHGVFFAVVGYNFSELVRLEYEAFDPSI